MIRRTTTAAADEALRPDEPMRTLETLRFLTRLRGARKASVRASAHCDCGSLYLIDPANAAPQPEEE
jgi:hypothetical protein